VPRAAFPYRLRGAPGGVGRQAYSYAYHRALLRRRHWPEPLLTPRPWALLFGRAVQLAGRRSKLALRPQPDLGARVALAQASGQLWGNPTYDWPAMRADGAAWWIARLDRAVASARLPVRAPAAARG